MSFQRNNKAAVGANHSKRQMVRQALVAELNEAASDGSTALRRIVKKLIEAAENGNVKAAALVFDRVDGKPAPSNVFIDGNELPDETSTKSARERIGRRLTELNDRRATEQPNLDQNPTDAKASVGHYDLSKLDTNELRQFRDLVKKAMRQ